VKKMKRMGGVEEDERGLKRLRGKCSLLLCFMKETAIYESIYKVRCPRVLQWLCVG
jgi:hypothetical protein